MDTRKLFNDNPSMRKFQPVKPLLLILGLLVLPQVPVITAQSSEDAADRLPLEVLDILPPSARVTGVPGAMQITQRSCRQFPHDQLRRRIVDAAVQEWAYFGFNVEELPTNGAGSFSPGQFRRPAMSLSEAQRLSSSIAGYWSATPNSDWILQRQNENWLRNGIDTRWRDAWSAAFISWVMCESGLGDPANFRRAIAHHSYIDQAIGARDGLDDNAMFIAREVGEQALNPGDLLCRGSRPVYRNLDQRRNQLGQGARTHCDIVVNVDESRRMIETIGGNVRGSVRMKRLPALLSDAGFLYPQSDRGGALFAHLQLNTTPIESNALDNSPVLASRTESTRTESTGAERTRTATD